MACEVRCKGCGRLLGVVKNGIFENKHGRQIIRAERAVVFCPKCGSENATGSIDRIDANGYSEEKNDGGLAYDGEGSEENR